MLSKSFPLFHSYLVILAFVLCTACNRPEQSSSPADPGFEAPGSSDTTAERDDQEPAPYTDFRLAGTTVRRIFQDSQGNLWFGTNSNGVFRYDGNNVEHFGKEECFGGWAVRKIVEDEKGNIWFGTNKGVIEYDGQSFLSLSK